MPTVYAFDPEKKKAWRLRVTHQWLNRYDNGKTVSIGYEVPREISYRRLKGLDATEVTYDEWNHSGCQSRCVKRGDAKCQW